MAFELPALPYDHDGLEPAIDDLGAPAETLGRAR